MPYSHPRDGDSTIGIARFTRLCSCTACPRVVYSRVYVGHSPLRTVAVLALQEFPSFPVVVTVTARCNDPKFRVSEYLTM